MATTHALPETNSERYARQTRNAAVTIAVIILVSAVAGIFVGCLAMGSLNSLNSNVNSTSTSSQLCQADPDLSNC
jgi:hypothetical protein